MNKNKVSDNNSDKWVPPLLQALSGQINTPTPIWFMRQAGRSLPEYRQARQGTGMLEACLHPELAAEITCQPVRRHGVDAAVFFSDIMVPLKLAEVSVDIIAGTGPVLSHPLRTRQDIDQLTSRRVTDPWAITQAVRNCVSELGSPQSPRSDGTWIPVLAFAGAPFTLAAYLVEGRPSRDHLAARRLMHADPQAWAQLLDWCAKISSDFLCAQVAGGAQAFQLFDSWAGGLSRTDYYTQAQPFSAQVLATSRELNIPSIHFGTGTSEFLTDLHCAGADCVGVDYRISLSEAIARLRAAASDKPVIVQGNIDPAYLATPTNIWRDHARKVISEGRQADGYIANLGHGVPPDTDPGVLTALVEFVHSL